MALASVREDERPVREPVFLRVLNIRHAPLLQPLELRRQVLPDDVLLHLDRGLARRVQAPHPRVRDVHHRSDDALSRPLGLAGSITPQHAHLLVFLQEVIRRLPMERLVAVPIRVLLLGEDLLLAQPEHPRQFLRP